MSTLTLKELALRTGEPPARLEKWKELGLIGCPDEECFRTEDIGRAKLIHDMLHYGHSLESIAEANRQKNSVFARFLEVIGERLSRPMYSIEEAARMAGLDPEAAKRLAEAGGVGEESGMVDDEDIGFFRSCKIALDAGYPEEGLAQILRVYADAMAKAAEVGHRTSHFYVHQPMLKDGQLSEQVLTRLENTVKRIEPLVEPALLYFFRRGSARAEWDDMLMHLEEEAGLAEKPEAPGQIRRAVMFVDLVNFTPMAEAMGDLRAAAVLQRFGQFVRTANIRCHGRIVKQIGDAFMVVFPECNSAVSCALEIEERASEEPQFPAVRSGLHWGTVLYRDGDYIGSSVNIASRLCEEAERHQVLVTEAVWRRARQLRGAEFVRLGSRRLKGLSAEVEVFEARHAGEGAAKSLADPVCRMELGAAEVAARLTMDGHEHVFCSNDCLRKFVAAPQRYAA